MLQARDVGERVEHGAPVGLLDPVGIVDIEHRILGRPGIRRPDGLKAGSPCPRLPNPAARPSHCRSS